MTQTGGDVTQTGGGGGGGGSNSGGGGDGISGKTSCGYVKRTRTKACS